MLADTLWELGAVSPSSGYGLASGLKVWLFLYFRYVFKPIFVRVRPEKRQGDLAQTDVTMTLHLPPSPPANASKS